METERFRYFTSNALQDYDYPTQNVPHRDFWNRLGVTDTWAYQQKSKDWDGEEQNVHAIDPLAAGNEEATQDLQQYLKTCFAILYVYDMLLREWHGKEVADTKWGYLIDTFFRFCGSKGEY